MRELKIRWRYGVLIGVFLALLSLYPQIYLKYQRGENYNGATFYYDYDEVIYAAYLQSLINGKPRRNDVYLGNDSTSQSETFMSIQFAAAYLPAIPARIFGVSSEGAFIFISAICAFLIGLTLFWLIAKITQNSEFAALATLFILLFGTGAAGYGILKETFGLGPSSFYLLFLRRFTPAVAYPFLFVLITSVWLGLKSINYKAKYFYAFITSVCFAFIVYSYFFIWTAVFGWLICLVLFSLIFEDNNRKNQLLNFWLPVFALLLLALIPYLILLSNRSEITDTSQILERTRSIVFRRPSLILGFGVLLAISIFIKWGWVSLNERLTVFIISFSILPLLIFNQHVITGYSLQPMHYNMYILNYLVLLGLTLLIASLWKEKLQKIKPVYWVVAALLIGFWGTIEMHYTTYNRFWYNLRRDEAITINRRLSVIANENPNKSELKTTLNFDSIQADNQPTIAPQAVLWSEHLFFLSNLTIEQHRRRYFLYLYFQNKDENWLRDNLLKCPNEACRALLGWGVNPTLQIEAQQMDDAKSIVIEEYVQFLTNFSFSEVSNAVISYIVVANNTRNDFTNVDLWYERGAEEKFGKFSLYQIKLKTR